MSAGATTCSPGRESQTAEQLGRAGNGGDLTGRRARSTTCCTLASFWGCRRDRCATRCSTALRSTGALVNSTSLYANLYQTEDYGTGADVQGVCTPTAPAAWLPATTAAGSTPPTLTTPCPTARGCANAMCLPAKPATRSALGESSNQPARTRSSARVLPQHRQCRRRGHGSGLDPTHPSWLTVMPNWRLSLFDRPGSWISVVTARNREDRLEHQHCAWAGRVSRSPAALAGHLARDGGQR